MITLTFTVHLAVVDGEVPAEDLNEVLDHLAEAAENLVGRVVGPEAVRNAGTAVELWISHGEARAPRYTAGDWAATS